MVLNELGSRITTALAAMSREMVIDEAVLDACLKEICSALLQSDVNVRLVAGLRNNIKKRVNMDELAAGLNKRKIIEKAVFDELCSILDSGIEATSSSSSSKAAGGKDGKQQPGAWQLKKGKPTVVMFVGLQGSGKTTTCTKYAYYYKKKGFKPALVCADTFRAGEARDCQQQLVVVAGCSEAAGTGTTAPGWRASIPDRSGRGAAGHARQCLWGVCAPTETPRLLCINGWVTDCCRRCCRCAWPQVRLTS